MDYRKHFSTTQTAQQEKIPGSVQEENNAGGYAWGVDDWTRLDRFLVLGSENGTYYVGEHKLTVDNAEAVLRCIKEDGKRVVATARNVSVDGRAPKNDPALFVLAMAAGLGDAETRAAALGALPDVARIGTHLFHFLQYVGGFRGWGRGLREAVASWYNDKLLDQLEYQAVKYRQRDGWSHRDVLRLAHPVPRDEKYNALYRWITQGEFPGESFEKIAALEKAKTATTAQDIAGLIKSAGLPREAIPTEWLSDPVVWEALFDVGMPLTAMIRNLANMTRLGVLSPLGGRTGAAIQTLSDKQRLHKARIHPLSVLVAMKTYASGQGMRGSQTWEPIPEIVDALDTAFYLAFDNVEPTNKRIVLALDVSGSMSWSNLAGLPITPREGSAAMALVTRSVELQSTVMAFSNYLVPVAITPKQRLDDVLSTIDRIRMGGTDCALPMLWALKNNVKADAFIVYTDSETWAGDIHPSQALAKYRKQTGIPAKLIVVGMVSNGFTIADPDDAGMLDIVGMDTATPQVMSDFIAG